MGRVRLLRCTMMEHENENGNGNSKLSELTIEKVRSMGLKTLAVESTKSGETDGIVSIPGFFRAVYKELGRDVPYDLFRTCFYDMDMPVEGDSIGSGKRVNRGNHSLFRVGDAADQREYRVRSRGHDDNSDHHHVNAYIVVQPQSDEEKATLIAMAERYNDVYIYPAGNECFVITPGSGFIN